jgi:uncharacterized membrane protein
MAFCSKCGAAIADGAAFCGKCGAPANAPAGPPPPPPVTAQPSTAQPNQMSSNIAALLAYILGLITGIIFLVIEPYKNDRFVRFHAFQSIFYCIAIFVIFIAWGIVGIVLGPILATLWFALGTLIRLGFFLLWLFLMYKAYNNERFMLPIIGDLAAKQAG